MKKKLIPFIAVAVLIIIIVLCIVVGNLIEKYTPTKERQDLTEYYAISSAQDTAIVLNNEVIDKKARMIDGVVYFDFETVSMFNPRFYWDARENKLLYTTSTDLVTVDVESSEYRITKDTKNLGHTIVKADAQTAYIAVDFVKLYSDFAYEIYAEPNRILVTTDWGSYDTAPVKKDTAVRVKGGIKSPILADIAKDTRVTVLKPDETWTKIATEEGIIGYVKSKLLGEITQETATSDYVEETFTHITKDFKINMGWHQVTTMAANQNIGSVLMNTKGINVISPTWFYLNDNNGNIASLASKEYVDYCHQNNIEVWALVSNLENKEVSTNEVLTYTSRRETLVNNLISAAIQYNLDGINVDLESIDAEIGDSYIQFIRELSLKCANNGIVLSVDNYVPTDYTAFYNRAEQALFADYVIIMAYDEHWSGSEEAGSVASIGFVRDGVTNTLKEVPAAQTILAMPFYTRVWSETPLADTDENQAANDEAESSDSYQLFTLDSYATNMTEAKKLVDTNGVVPAWSDQEGQYYAQYENNGVTYKIWLEDATSLEQKLNVMKDHDLAGGAFWKLGLETPDVWDTIIKYIN